MTMRKFLFVLLAVLLFSCDTGERNPVPVIPENTTGNYHTVFLFEIEGVRVYRFHDSGHSRYLAIGPNVQNVQTVQSSTRTIGKMIQTEYWDYSVIYVENNGVMYE
jgi:hypothetical protein